MSVPAVSMNAGIAAAVDQGVRAGDGEDAIPEGEMLALKKLRDEYEAARAFDKHARQRYARDRRYAAGTSNPTWASDANIIGAFIDILISFLYAKDPDVSVRPAEHVDPPPPPPQPPLAAAMGAALAPPVPGALPGDPLAALAPPAPAPDPFAMDPMTAFGSTTGAPGIPPVGPVTPPPTANKQTLTQQDNVRFAKTLQIVISKSWKKANIKRIMKRVVRSSLSVGPGWFKAYVYEEQGKNPKLEKELKDARDNLERIQKLEEDLTGLEPEVDPALTEEQLGLQIAGLQKRVELLVKRGLCADFIRAEDIQVSIDVPFLADYRDADWISHDLYIEKGSAKSRFLRLSEEDISKAAEYVQPHDNGAAPTPMNGYATQQTGIPEGTYVRAAENQGAAAARDGKDGNVKFVKVVELWDHRDMNVKTFMEGVDRWAEEPYPPEHASSRFYPFFQLALYEVDGTRHPQSLSDRGWKLQDEYSSRRSSGRKTRERAIPGIVALGGQLDPDNCKKLEQSVEQEIVVLQTTTPDADIKKILSEKPYAAVDPAVFDTADVLRDFQMVSGVQEAQILGQSQANTATEADINQSGFASRTGADRETEEEMLTEFALYTAEVAIQGLTARDVTRMAGPFAFWPEGMDIEDILTLVEVEIQAGTTGKPRAQADKETWATLLPLILEQLPLIQQDEMMGNTPMAETRKNILRETLKRLDDRLTLESIIAAGPAPVMAPGMPGAAPPSAPPGAGSPPTGNGSVNNPVAQGAPAV